MLDVENKAIKEHRAKRRVARTRAEKELVGEWKPERMVNGETKPQIMALSRHITLMHKSEWNAQQQARAEILFQSNSPNLADFSICILIVNFAFKKTYV